MFRASQGLDLKVVWYDEDLLEVQLTVSNGQFAGEASFYTTPEQLQGSANHLDGFPSNASDSREFELGSLDFEPNSMGGAKFKFTCIDSCGHLALTVSIAGSPRRSQATTDSALITIQTEPAEIDSFVSGLRNLGPSLGALAELRQAT